MIEHVFGDFKKGNLSPFYTAVYPDLLVWVARILGEELSFLAEDCVQEAVYETYRNAASFENVRHWRVFLYTCARNNAISLCRKAQTQRDYAARGDAPFAESVESGLIRHEVMQAIDRVLRSLSEQERELFYLSFELGLKNADIARRLSVAEITVKKRKARLVATLRSRLRGLVPDRSLSLLLLAMLGDEFLGGLQ